MKLKICFLILLLHQSAYSQKLSVYDLTCEHKVNPIGIDVKEPSLSWKIKSEGKNITQSAYAIRVFRSPTFSNSSSVWESGKINSTTSILVGYAGPPVQSGKKYYWQVKIWDNNEKTSDWSTAAFWETGFLSHEDWKANWVEPVQDTARKMPALHLRKNFFIQKAVESATVYVTSHGFYELQINGSKVGDQVLTPGWTSYNKRLQYQVYYVGSLVKQGDNAIGAILGDGWYRGTLGWIDGFGIWGKKLALLCQLNIKYKDGTQEIIVSDKTWKGTQNGPITLNGIYDGETYDARKELLGWSSAKFDDHDWKLVSEVAHPKNNLIGSESVPIRKVQEIKPIKIFRTPKGVLVADLGQNMVGWIKLKVSGRAGTIVTIKHAEMLDKNGEFYTENLRAADATARYVLKGGGEEVYEPRLTFFGFRFIAIDGFPGELKAENITGVVVHSDMKPTGSFTCSNPLVNKLQQNITWGQKGNFVDVPTDCPQRDERLGWTGDAQAFCRTAAFNMDVATFFNKWMKDVSADQTEEGAVPWVIPDVLRNKMTSAGWGDVATVAPWTMYQVYGNKAVLETQYKSMKAYVDYIRSKAGNSFIWKSGSVFGDWLYYKPQMENHTEPDGYTDPDMIATMFFAYSSKLVSQAARVLGKTDDEKLYKDVFENIKKVFLREYVTSSGRIFSDSQTAYVLALYFDLLPEELKKNATEYLVNDIKKRGNHLSTGFLGTPYLCHVLSNNGQLSVGYDLLLQETFPSWLYPVKMGATTIWERWDGQKPDSTFQDKNMNSFNHYAYGAVGDWMYRVVAGIEIGSPGYTHILIQPKPDKRLSFARATYESPYGKISSSWEIKDNVMKMEVGIPPNTRSTITIPSARVESIKENGKSLSQVYSTARQNGNDVVVEVGSGSYRFEYEIIIEQ
jgi:alpha-L-rhamnosidase